MESTMETTKLAGRLWAKVSCTYQSVELSNADIFRIHHCVLFPRHQIQSQLSKKQIAHICRKGHL